MELLDKGRAREGARLDRLEDDALVAAVKRLADEKSRRAAHGAPVEVMAYRHDGDDPLAELAPPGTITVYLGRRDSKALSALRAAAEGDGKQARKVMERFREQSADREIVSLEEAAEHICSKESIFDVQYAGRTVASNLFVPEDSDLIGVVLPYNGGRFDARGLQLRRYSRAGKDEAGGVEAVALRHPPRLTKAERAALAALPRGDADRNVGEAMLCYAICLVAVAVLVTLAAVCSYSVRPPFAVDDDPRIRLSPDQLERLGPQASAAALLNVRRRALEMRRRAR